MPKKPKFIKARGGKPNASAERKYRNELLRIVNEINSLIRQKIVPILKRDGKPIDVVADSVEVNDGPVAEITEAFAVIQGLLSLDDRENKGVGSAFVGSVAATTNAKTSAMLERAGFALPTNRDIIARQGLTEALDALTAENASLVTKMSQEYIDRIQRAVLDNYLTGKYVGNGGVLKELGRISGITKKRAKLIARDQSNKIHGTVTRLQAQATGSAGYEWNNVRDERVRGNPSGKYPNSKYNHWDRDGEYFLWKPMKNPPISPNGKPFRQPPKDGMPGEPINCRCFASPVWIEQ